MSATAVAIVATALAACGQEQAPEQVVESLEQAKPRPEIYADFTLTADLGYLTDGQREMIGLLIEASRIMDDLFWKQAYGPGYEEWLDTIADADARRFAEINYGPWDRLDNEVPFIEGVGPKPPGANFYPADMTVEEFEAAYLPDKQSLYTLLRRDDEGRLTVVPYHVAYAAELGQAAALLREAAGLAESTSFANYLKLRANALISDQYQVSDLYWMDVKDNEIDVVIGAIETYEDRLFGYKAGGTRLPRGTDARQAPAVSWKWWRKRIGRGLGGIIKIALKGCRFPSNTSWKRRDRTRISMPTTSSFMPGTAMPARRRSRSTCRMTKRCSSKRGRGACSSKTRCRRSSRRSWCR